MYCRHCGKEISDLASICVGCGNPVAPSKKYEEEHAGAGWWWLGFLIPILGFILWVVYTGDQEQKAKKLLRGAIAGIVVSVVSVVLIYIVYFLLLIFALSL